MPLISLKERVYFVLGLTFLVLVVPFVGGVVGSCVLWDGLDRLFRGRPLDGVLMSFARWVNKVASGRACYLPLAHLAVDLCM